MAITTEPGLRQASSAYRDLPFEDMLDVLDMYEPAMTPAFTMARREKELGNTEFWTEVDSWQNPSAAVGPGDAYALQAGEVRDVIANRRKVGNGGQAFRRASTRLWPRAMIRPVRVTTAPTGISPRRAAFSASRKAADMNRSSGDNAG